MLPSVVAPCTQCDLNFFHIYNNDPKSCQSCTLIEMQLPSSTNFASDPRGLAQHGGWT